MYRTFYEFPFIAFCFTLVSFIPAQLIAQAPQPDSRRGTASISGRVTVSGKPTANVTVTINADSLGRGIREDFFGDGNSFFQQAKTDADGRFQFLNLPAGTFHLNAGNMLFIHDGDDRNRRANLTLDDGESIENITLALVRGGVITGRVKDARGKPVVMAQVRTMIQRTVGPDRVELQEYRGYSREIGFTDDRGIYRIFGLPKGKYAIALGRETQLLSTNLSLTGVDQVWYPSTTDQKEAKLLEIEEGAVLTGIDLTLGEEKETFAASGRVIVDETGAPVPNVDLYVSSNSRDRFARNHLQSAAQSDKEGRFQFPDLPNGPYRFQVNAANSGSSYHHAGGEFNIADANIDSLEVRLLKGATVEGSIFFDGTPAPEFLANLKSNEYWMHLTVATNSSAGPDPNRFVSFQVTDNKFRALGVPPGKVRFGYEDWILRGWHLVRIEQNGNEISQGFEVRGGQKVNGLRLVFAEGKGRIQGEVRLKDSALPAHTWISVMAVPVASNRATMNEAATAADQKGRFVIEGLLPGEYEIKVYIGETLPNNQRRAIYFSPSAEQRVTVSNSAEVNVNIEVDPAKSKKEGAQ
jgi:uncharacterized GH25 family protein